MIQSDYYSIDFQEEKSGLSGRLVWRQALYVNECLRTILARYPKGTSAILVAHSMGGIIARGIFHLPNFFAGSVSTILTLGSPHRQPYIHADRYLAAFYDKTNSFWALATVNNTVVPVPPLSSLFPASASSVPSRVSYRDVSNVLLISISGGFRDHMIEPHLADLSGLTPAAQSLSVLTHSIPDVRLTVDHQV